MRQDFEMTQQDLDTLLEAMKPQPMIMLQCGSTNSAQERANAAWKTLGMRMGFDHMTVRPNGKGDRFFSAEPKCRGMEIESGVFSGCDQSGGDCPNCGK
jgi:hypothetical protein